MKLIPMLTTAILATTILTAQAAPKGEQELTPTTNSQTSTQSEIDSKKEVAYTSQRVSRLGLNWIWLSRAVNSA